jgi:DNA mismatch endonuclease (patch repair protein)
MRRIKSQNTAPELAIRRLLYSLGYRYRLHGKNLPGKPDIVFWGRRKVIFVHGCFWHAHGCRKSHQPQTNQHYWSPKLLRNKERDERNSTSLAALGWQSLVVWECEAHQPAPAITQRLIDFLEENY